MGETSQDRFGDDFGGERMWGLKELPYPEPLAFTPETAGWLILGGALLVLLIWQIWRVYRRHQQNRYRRDAAARLAGLHVERAAELPLLLRKVALISAERSESAAGRGRSTVASLRGDAWIQWLNDQVAEPLFEPADAGTLDSMAYAGEPIDPETFDLMKASTTRWVENHRA